MDYTDTLVADLKHHPRVCSHCFRLLRHEDPLPVGAKRHRHDAVAPLRTPTTETTDGTPPGGVVSDRRPRRICDCGTVHPFAEVRRTAPIDMDTLVGFADNLSQTCEALAQEQREQRNLAAAERYDHDRDVLFECVRHLKAQPANQHKDDTLLAVGLAVARRRAD